MHLLNVHTLELEQFPCDPPPYATLSHRWGKPDDEISYQDMIQLATRPRVKKKPGFAKIMSCVEQAMRHNLAYVWIDTCCINQSNSVELNEAINSMWQWYLDCDRCFVYMSDVRSEQDLDADDSDFACSEWFKRGWTLQELVAPPRITFFAKDWKQIGKMGQQNVTRRVSFITGIPEQVLLDGEVSSLSVARRMFWASKRETTRKEDKAYSLMGLFDITMPIIYGGKDNAFVRFQKEIMKTSVDHSMFAWTAEAASPTATTGLLAPSPSYFADVDEIPVDVFDREFSSFIERDPPSKTEYSDTNNGISITLPMRPVDDSIYLAMLRCTCPQHPVRPLCIYLQMLAGPRNQWVRTRIKELIPLPRDGKLFQNRSIFVKQDTSFFDSRRRKRAVSDHSCQQNPSRRSTMRPRLSSMSHPRDKPEMPLQETISSRLAMFSGGKSFASLTGSLNLPRWGASRHQSTSASGHGRDSLPSHAIATSDDDAILHSRERRSSSQHASAPPDYRSFLAELFSEKPVSITWRPQPRRRPEQPEQQQSHGRRLIRSMSPAPKKSTLGHCRSRSLSPDAVTTPLGFPQDSLTKDGRQDNKQTAPRGPTVVERSQPLSVSGRGRSASAGSSRGLLSSQTNMNPSTAHPPREHTAETSCLFRGRSLRQKPLRKNLQGSRASAPQIVITDADDAPKPSSVAPSPVSPVSATLSSTGNAKIPSSTPSTPRSTAKTLSSRPDSPSPSTISSHTQLGPVGPALKPVSSLPESSKSGSKREALTRVFKKLFRRKQA